MVASRNKCLKTNGYMTPSFIAVAKKSIKKMKMVSLSHQKKAPRFLTFIRMSNKPINWPSTSSNVDQVRTNKPPAFAILCFLTFCTSFDTIRNSPMPFKENIVALNRIYYAKLSEALSWICIRNWMIPRATTTTITIRRLQIRGQLKVLKEEELNYAASRGV